MMSVNQTPLDDGPAGRIAGVDFGTKRIGIAITDASRSIASPLVGYERTSPDRDAIWFRNLVAQECIVQFIVGLPMHMSGDESQKSEEAREFGAWLEQVTKVAVGFHDERYSTRQANEWMKSSKLTRRQQHARRDMLAAQAILASYLESSSSSNARRNQPLDDEL